MPKAQTTAVSNVRKPLLTSLCLLAALAFALLLVQDREPSFNGRSLSLWLHTPALHPTPDNFGLSPEAVAAIRAMGTNTIPAALRWIRYEPSTLRQQARPLALHIPQRFWPSFVSRNYHLAIDAETVFYILGPTAKPAIPELVSLATSSKGEARSGRCARALAAIGPEALPALAAVIENPHTKDRSYVVERLQAQPGAALPILLKLLQDPERDVAARAATVLGFEQPSSSVVVPALVTNLQNTTSWRRCAAAAALARYGSAARAAIPALQQTLSDPDMDVRMQSVLSLHYIDPETFTNLPPGMTAW